MTIWCKRIGSGSPTRVLLHGTASNSGTFLNLLPYLRGKGSCVLIDLPGHGKSTVPRSDRLLEEMVGAVLAAVREHCTGSFQLVGHSMGGMIASHVAAAMPERTDHVYVISCAGVGPLMNLTFFRHLVAAETPQELLSCLSMLYAQPPANFEKICTGTLAWLKEPGVRPFLVNLLEHAGELKADFGTALARGVRVSGLWGKDDSILPAENSQQFPAEISLRILDGVGHAPHVEVPAKVAKWLLDRA